METDEEVAVRFHEARLKVKRANEHVAEVNRRVGIVVSPDSHTIWTEIDPESKIQIARYRIEGLDDLPDIALILGDAIHNFKTALDYAWLGTIAILAPTAVSKFAKFPVYGSIKELESALKSKNLDVVSPPLFNFILSDMKPYDGGNLFIWAIHKLDVMDKHRLLIPTANYGSIEDLKLTDERGKIYKLGSWGTEFKGETYSVAAAPGITVQQEGRVSLEIIFKEGPLKSLEVREALRIFSATVLKVVELLEKLVEG